MVSRIGLSSVSSGEFETYPKNSKFNLYLSRLIDKVNFGRFVYPFLPRLERHNRTRRSLPTDFEDSKVKRLCPISNSSTNPTSENPSEIKNIFIESPLSISYDGLMTIFNSKRCHNYLKPEVADEAVEPLALSQEVNEDDSEVDQEEKSPLNMPIIHRTTQHDRVARPPVLNLNIKANDSSDKTSASCELVTAAIAPNDLFPDINLPFKGSQEFGSNSDEIDGNKQNEEKFEPASCSSGGTTSISNDSLNIPTFIKKMEQARREMDPTIARKIRNQSLLSSSSVSYSCSNNLNLNKILQRQQEHKRYDDSRSAYRKLKEKSKEKATASSTPHYLDVLNAELNERIKERERSEQLERASSQLNLTHQQNTPIFLPGIRSDGTVGPCTYIRGLNFS